eukprot:3517848-Alexandrium_andersonii.AAC.1
MRSCARALVGIVALVRLCLCSCVACCVAACAFGVAPRCAPDLVILAQGSFSSCTLYCRACSGKLLLSMALR